MKRISLSEEVIASSSSGSSQFDKGNDEGKEMDTDAAEEKSREDKDTTVKEQEQEQVERKVVVTFHGLADAVHDVLASIQGLVSRKHAEFTLAQGGWVAPVRSGRVGSGLATDSSVLCSGSSYYVSVREG